MLSPVPIDPNAVYDDGTIVLALDMAPATLVRARREGRLRFSRKGKRTFYLGQWIIDWLSIEASPAVGREVVNAAS
jgi:hypothetical protein